jgi:hypothetical protein
MTLPLTSNIEIPILQELVAVGGSDDVRFLYQRLISYFPSLSDGELFEIRNNANRKWRNAVQKAGKALDERRYIRRERGFWQITESGRKLVSLESDGFVISKPEADVLTHERVQQLIVEIGDFLGFYAAPEFEFYDVVWRTSRESQRISHVFEVQSKGNIDSAFAKLKRAYDAQRSHPFLILSSERDTNRAAQSINREFREIQEALSILSFVEIQKIHVHLDDIRELLPKFLKI